MTKLQKALKAIELLAPYALSRLEDMHEEAAETHGKQKARLDPYYARAQREWQRASDYYLQAGGNPRTFE